MSNLAIAPQLHLGPQELTRLTEFIGEGGLERNLALATATPGLLVDTGDEWRPILDDAQQLTLRVAPGYAIDAGGHLLRHTGTRNLALPIPNTWYWLRARYQVRTIEEGTLTVSASGTLTGTGTHFTQVLRGGPFHPTRIRLFAADGTPAPLNGVSDHLVVDVVNDTELLLATQGLQNEVALRYAVVGAFAAGYVTQPADEFPFRYDDCELQLEPETSLGQAPALPNTQSPRDTFTLARVMRDAQTLYIEDKRRQLWRSRAAAQQERVRTAANPLLGIEAIKWNPAGGPRHTNTVFVGWAFRAEGWSLDAAALQITLSVGLGGRYLSTSDVQPNDFSGWRLYREDRPEYLRIRACTKPTPATVRLTLERADPDFFGPDGGDLVITPDCDAVVVKLSPEHGIKLGENIFEFPVNTPQGRCEVHVPEPKNLVQLRCAHLVGGHLTHYYLTEDSYYYAENQWDALGELKSQAVRTTSPFPSTFWAYRAPDSLADFKNKIDLGDLKGVEYHAIEPSTPVLTLTVGIDRQYQVLEANPNPYTFAQNQVVNLSTVLDAPGSNPATPTPARNGNQFLLHFKGDFQTNSFGLSINQHYVDPTTTGDVLRRLTVGDRQAARKPAGLLVVATFDGTDWVLAPLGASSEGIGTLKLISRVGSYNPLDKFGADGLGTEEWEDWAEADGRHGTDDWRGQVGLGLDRRQAATLPTDSLGKYDAQGNLVENYGKLGNTGGESWHKLTTPELARHRHKEGFHIVDGGSSYPFVAARNGADGANGSQDDLYTEEVGDNKPHENRMRYRVAAWVQKIR